MLFKKKSNGNSRSVIYERLQVRAHINKDANPLLLMLEERISDLLKEKYTKDFQVNGLNSHIKDPNYEVDAEVDYHVEKDEKNGFWSKLFGKKKSNGVVKNRLDIMIQGKKDNCMLIKIKDDIYQMAKEIVDVNPDNITVERCYEGNAVEIIKMVVSLPEK